MTYRTCKRCSVIRVNILCDLYEKAHHEGQEKALRDLSRLVQLAAERGFKEGGGLVAGGLGRGDIRPLCWNVSSLLEDEDLTRLGYKVK